MAPYCTETEALFTGEMYASGDGTKVLELGDGTIILERKDGVQVSKVIASGFYCIDVESFQRPGTESNLNTLVTTIKVIVGGVAPLLMPWCIKNQGLVGGPLTVLSQYTVKQLVEYRDAVVVETGRDDLTYVDVARHAFGDVAANSVFFMTIVNSLGVCAAYSSFIGSTMATLSATPGNIIFDVFPSITTNYWQIAAAAVVLPLNTLAGNSRFLSVVAYMGAGALAAGVLTTCWYGFSVTPDFLGNLAALPWFTTPQEYFTSFGVVPLLFCVHFAVLSIERNMKTRGEFPTVLSRATIACVIANALFGSLGFAFFGDATDSVVLNNLGQGSFLTWVRLALVADMMVSYPVMLSSSREICESALLGSFASSASKEGGMMERLQAIDWQDLLARNAVRSGLILSAFAIAQLNDVGKICNLVGGVFQVILAFVIPPALALKGAELWGRPGLAAGADGNIPEGEQDDGYRERMVTINKKKFQSYATIIFGGVCCFATLAAFFADVLSH